MTQLRSVFPMSVARRPSSRPADARMKAPVQTLAIRRLLLIASTARWSAIGLNSRGSVDTAPPTTMIVSNGLALILRVVTRKPDEVTISSPEIETTSQR